MAFRLPTNLDASFLPPPSQQVAETRPWRGTLIVNGIRCSSKSTTPELRVTAVETDGDNHADLWPSQFIVQPTHERPVLRDVQSWVNRHNPPVCTFMPDRLRDPDENAVNQSTFRSLSRILFENQMVAIALWNGHNRISGAGIILYPAQNSSALLVGAIFLTSPFPNFIPSSPPVQLLQSPTQRQARQPTYQQPVMTVAEPYGSISRNTHHNIPSQRHPAVPSPSHHGLLHHEYADQRSHYGYTVPRSYNNVGGTSSADPWTAIKDEEAGDMSGFSSDSGGHGHSHYQ